jgi:hypothetical protein
MKTKSFDIDDILGLKDPLPKNDVPYKGIS